MATWHRVLLALTAVSLGGSLLCGSAESVLRKKGQQHADTGDSIAGDATQPAEWAVQRVRMRRRLLAEVQHAPDQLQPAQARVASDQTGNGSRHGDAYSGSQQDGSSLPDRFGRATHAHDGHGDGTGHRRTEDGTHEAEFGDVSAEKHHASSGDLAASSGQKTQPADAVHKAHLAAKHDAKHRQHQQRLKVGPLPPGQATDERRQALQLELDGEAGSGERTLRRSDALTRSAAERAAHVAAGGQPRQKATIPQVFVMTTLMASCSGLGAVPFFFLSSLSEEWAALANAVACGVMLAASFDLVHEGQPYGAAYTILGVILGALFIKASQEKLEKWEGVRFEGLQGISARKAVLLVTVMGAHALGEGSGVGVSFCGDRGWAQGVLVTLAIGLHNIPEGLAVATSLVARGVAARQALLWAVLTSLPQALVAVPAFMFVSAFQALLPIALGFAAGCMVWMVFAELLPDALQGCSHAKIATAATFSAAWLEALRMGFALLERPDGSLASPFLGDAALSLPTLLVLLPAAAPAAMAGGLVAAVAKPGALLLGGAAGLLAWGGAGSLVRLPWSGSLGLFWTLAWAAGGGTAAIIIYGQLLGSADSGKVKADDDQGCQAAACSGPPHAAVNGEAWIPAAGRLIAQLSPRAGDASLARSSWDSMAADQALHANRLQPADGTVLPSYMRPPPQGPGGFSSGGSSSAVLGSRRLGPMALVAAGAAVLDGVPTGLRAAGHILAAASASEAGRLWLPLAVDALLRGLAGAALAAAVVGNTIRRTVAFAAAVGSTPALVAVVQVARMPSHGHPAAAEALFAAKWQAATAGAALVAALWLLQPEAGRVRNSSASKGMALGVALSASAHLLLGMLCLMTPYCLSLTSQ